MKTLRLSNLSGEMYVGTDFRARPKSALVLRVSSHGRSTALSEADVLIKTRTGCTEPEMQVCGLACQTLAVLLFYVKHCAVRGARSSRSWKLLIRDRLPTGSPVTARPGSLSPAGLPFHLLLPRLGTAGPENIPVQGIACVCPTHSGSHFQCGEQV